ncbi:MAG TPA: NADH-quinone oxidoreductase subunit J [Bacteroidia bacterium]|nr:NADH-quinone oxidoreductase subunit J [Bacteroidia bacterium]
MSISAIVFYLLSALILGAGLLAVTTRKIFRSAIYLLGSLVGIAGLYFWMEVEFIAAVQIVVYVGGIVVLIIFSIFLTQQSGRKMQRTSTGRTVAALLASVFGFLLACSLIHQYGFSSCDKPFDTNVQRIGTLMLNTGDGGFALPFEVVSILLLAAMIGCIVIALKTDTEEK